MKPTELLYIDEAVRRAPVPRQGVRQFEQLAGGGEWAIGDEFHAANPGRLLGAVAGGAVLT